VQQRTVQTGSPEGNEIQTLTASVKEQAAQIQKVSDQVELKQPAPQVAGNNQ
jgi:hypothetical protein